MLPPQETHVWRTASAWPAAILRQFESFLDGEERAQALRFHFAPDREQFVVAHAALRVLLGAYLNSAARQLRFSAGAHGKPGLVGTGQDDLFFNLAHSQGLVLIAVARGHEVGVDLEYRRGNFDFDVITQRFFSPAENAQLDGLPPDARRQAFFAGWTRKEALLKGLGRGLAHLDQVEVSLLAGEPITVRANADYFAGLARWSLQALDAGDEYAAALAVEGHGFTVRCFDWNPSGFISGH